MVLTNEFRSERRSYVAATSNQYAHGDKLNETAPIRKADIVGNSQKMTRIDKQRGRCLG